MRILVTGAGGFCGSHLVSFFQERNYNVIPIYKYIRDTVLPDSDVVVHAGATSPENSVSKAHLYQNVVSTYNLINYAQFVDIKKIVFFSSNSLYGTIKGGTLFEDSPIIDPSFYGQTKAMCEGLFSEADIPTISLRLPCIVGRGSKRNWLSRLRNQANMGEPVHIYNPEILFNNVVHINFLCELIDKLIKTDFETDSILVASTNGVQIRDIVRRVVRGRVPVYEDAPVAKESFLISIDKLYKFMEPWTTEKSVDQFIEDTL